MLHVLTLASFSVIIACFTSSTLKSQSEAFNLSPPMSASEIDALIGSDWLNASDWDFSVDDVKQR